MFISNSLHKTSTANPLNLSSIMWSRSVYLDMDTNPVKMWILIYYPASIPVSAWIMEVYFLHDLASIPVTVWIIEVYYFHNSTSIPVTLWIMEVYYFYNSTSIPDIVWIIGVYFLHDPASIPVIVWIMEVYYFHDSASMHSTFRALCTNPLSLNVSRRPS